MAHGFAGALFGVLVVYICGAVVAWDINPGEWGIFWRFWCIGWAIIWGIGGAAMAVATEDQR